MSLIVLIGGCTASTAYTPRPSPRKRLVVVEGVWTGYGGGSYACDQGAAVDDAASTSAAGLAQSQGTAGGAWSLFPPLALLALAGSSNDHSARARRVDAINRYNANPACVPIPRGQTRGFSLDASLGYRSGGGIGVACAYQHKPIRDWLKVGAWAGAGARLPPRDGESIPGAGVGLWGALGWAHRAILGVGTGFFTPQWMNLHGTVISGRRDLNLVAAAGYEAIGAGGLVFRLMFGSALHVGRSFDDTGTFEPTATLTLGVKPW